MKRLFSEVKIDKDSGLLIVRRESGEFLSGSDRMVAVGGGVKARIAKTRDNQYLVQEYLFDKNRFTEESVEAWLNEKSKSYEVSLTKVQENAPKGSFQDITMRLCYALNQSGLYLDEYGNNRAYVAWVFTDYFVACVGEAYYKINYSEGDGGSMILGEPEKVDMEFVAAECAKQNTKLDKRGQSNMTLVEFGMPNVLLENLDAPKKQVRAVLIEAGTNYSKKRHYPKRTIQESAPLFAGLKMYLNHPTSMEERERPERDVREWVATITESWYDEGKVLANIAIHANWLWQLFESDPVFREHIGISINAAGRASYSQIDGQTMEVVEKIVTPQSVDWVTEAGARGRVLQLIESEKREEQKTMLKTMTLHEVKTERPDLFQIHESEVRAKVAAEFDAKKDAIIKEAVAPIQRQLDELTVAKKKDAQRTKITSLVEASQLPKQAQGRLIESLSKSIYETDEKLDASVKQAVSDELKYLTEVGGFKIKSDGSVEGNTQLQEGAAHLLKRLGVKTEEKK